MVELHRDLEYAHDLMILHSLCWSIKSGAAPNDATESTKSKQLYLYRQNHARAHQWTIQWTYLSLKILRTLFFIFTKTTYSCFELTLYFAIAFF